MTDPTNLTDSELIAFLQKTPANGMTDTQRLQLKDRRPTPPLNIFISSKPSRKFQLSWYEKFPWLAGCSARNRMFCYVCLLFGCKETDWCLVGYNDLSNVLKVGARHQSSQQHLRSREALIMLGRSPIERTRSESARLAAAKHNEAVDVNRQVLKRLVHGLVYLCKQGLPPGSFSQLPALLAQNEPLVRQHLETSPLFKGALPDMQYDLIEVVSDVLVAGVKAEVKETRFVSVQVDDISDLVFQSRISVILRYSVDGAPQERFVGSFGVPEFRTGLSVAELLVGVLTDWGVDLSKVVSQTYDGTFVVDREGVQHYLRNFCPGALFVHSHAHLLSSVLLQAAKALPEVHCFARALATVESLFDPGTARFQRLVEYGLILTPDSWDFQTRVVPTVVKYFSEVKAVCGAVTEGCCWDADTFASAAEVMRRLDEPTFVFLLCLFEKCSEIVDPLSEMLASSADMSRCQKRIERAIQTLSELRVNDTIVDDCVEKSSTLNETLSFSKADKKDLALLTERILTAAVAQLEARFEDFPRAQFVEILDYSAFPVYKKKYPILTINKLLSLFPLFQRDQLQNELINVYDDARKCLPPRDLLQYLVVNGIDCVYEEVTKLIELVVTLPSSPIGSESINPPLSGKAVKRLSSTPFSRGVSKSAKRRSSLPVHEEDSLVVNMPSTCSDTTSTLPLFSFTSLASSSTGSPLTARKSKSAKKSANGVSSGKRDVVVSSSSASTCSESNDSAPPLEFIVIKTEEGASPPPTPPCSDASVTGVTSTSVNSALLTDVSCSPSVTGFSLDPLMTGVLPNPLVTGGVSLDPLVTGGVSLDPLVTGVSSVPLVTGVSSIPLVTGVCSKPSVTGVSLDPLVTGVPPVLVTGVSSASAGTRVVNVRPTPVPSEKSSCTLSRLRCYLKKCMKDSSLSLWGLLAVEGDLLSDFSADPAFMNRVIDLYAERVGRQFDFIPQKL